jgi:hypothetical protein
MTDINWGRLAAIAGIIFAITFVVGVITASPSFDTDDPDDEVVQWYRDSDHQTLQIIGGYIVVVSAVAFLVFLGHLRARLVAAEGAPGQLATIAFAAGVVFVALLLAGMILWIAPAGGDKFGGEDIPDDAGLLRILPQAGFGMVVLAGAWAVALAIAVASWAILRSGILARWLAYLGFVCAVVLLFGAFFIPMVALPIWAIATSVGLWRRPAMSAAM